MTVQLETQLIWYGREYLPGDQIELPEADARRFLERGMASLPAPEIETAAIQTHTPKGKRDGRNTATR
jgi:hypothetical protein